MLTGSEREASIEAVINWLLENPDTSSSDVVDSEGREAAAVDGNSSIYLAFSQVLS